MDDDILLAVVAAIPPGHWMSYGDVCAAAGGEPRQALGVNMRLERLGAPGAHRVLKSDGTVSPTALGDPRKVHNALAKERLTFVRGRADPDARILLEDAEEAVAA
jgi:alkylated DNA nucleotide flippase Atl1